MALSSLNRSGTLPKKNSAGGPREVMLESRMIGATAKIIRNPVLRGFRPDPSILRVGDDFFIATSTFEWFPGVEIHHSRDLVHWQLLIRPLSRVSQLDLAGVPHSGGVWAPCLSHDGERFYLCATNVRSIRFPELETPNFLVTATDIGGPWSDPIALNDTGFDPSLFHDEDGRKWLVNMRWRGGHDAGPFGGIVLQEFSWAERRLIGPVRNIFSGTEMGSTEGPHLYKRGGWYYLMCAEGGTGFGHAVTMARSRSIEGPYEVDPQNPVLTSRDRPELEIQKAGHASLVSTPRGEWYLAHLGARPVGAFRRCPLGRETCLQRVEWIDAGWLRKAGGGRHPEASVRAPGLDPVVWPSRPARDDFDSPSLGPEFQTLRLPPGRLLSLSERPGFLRLWGGPALESRGAQALAARRVESVRFRATTHLEFEPEVPDQSAGLICLYDASNYFYLRIVADPAVGRRLEMVACDRGRREIFPDRPAAPESGRACGLRAEWERETLQFFYSPGDGEWRKIGPVLDATKLSDEYCHEFMAFTGAFVGLCAQSPAGGGPPADFDDFEYLERTGPEDGE